MSKVAKSFRLDPVAVEHLDELVSLTGSSQAAIIEQSLAIYRSLLLGGLAGPRRMFASTMSPALGAAEIEFEPDPSRPRRTAPQKPPEPVSSAYRVQAKGATYEFPFPVSELPAKGSGSCPCGSGKRFAQCHTKVFQKALKAGITQRG